MTLSQADRDAAAPHVGQVFGTQYKIKELVATGHFSLVLLAEDMSTGRDVAIKAPRFERLDEAPV